MKTLILSFVLTFSFLNLAAQNISLHEAVLGGGLSVPANNGCITLGDIDGDGDPDAIVSGEDPSLKTTLYWNDGNGNFTAVATTLPSVRFGKLGLVDVDKDGDLDLFITGGTYSSLTDHADLYLNDGSGNFTMSPSMPFQTQSSGDFVFEDVDNDNDLDLLLSGYTNDPEQVHISLYLNNGYGVFTEAVGSPFNDVAASSIAFIDMENDGDQDVILTGRDANNNNLTTLYKNDGNGNFSPVSAAFDHLTSGTVSVADTDGDGDEDVFIYNSLYSNDGAGNFSLVANTPFHSSSLGTSDFADFDNDGDADLLIIGSIPMGSFNGFQSAIYENLGDNTFTESDILYRSNISGYAISSAIDDIDLDDDLDILTVGVPSNNFDVQKHINSTEVHINLDGTGITITAKPTEETFEIQGLSDNYTIKILDATEALVQTLDTYGNSMIVDTRNLPDGFYFLRVEDPNNSLLSVQTILKE